MKQIFWTTRTFKDIPTNFDWLHPNEKTVLSGLKYQKRKQDWLLGRWTAKYAIKHYLKESLPFLNWSAIEIQKAEDGAPETRYMNNSLPVTISISHREGMSICAVSETKIKVGCDLEVVEKRSMPFIKDYFTEVEQDVILGVKEPHRSIYANLFWSAKESTLKAIRIGLRQNTRDLEVQFENGLKRNIWQKMKVFHLKNGNTFNGYWKLKDQYILTLVSPLQEFEILKI